MLEDELDMLNQSLSAARFKHLRDKKETCYFIESSYNQRKILEKYSLWQNVVNNITVVTRLTHMKKLSATSHSELRGHSKNNDHRNFHTNKLTGQK